MIVVDTETTGLDPYKNSIVSIGALDLFNPENQFYQECKIWDGAEVTEEALKINGFSDAEIIDPNKKDLEEIIKDFLKWAEDIKDKTMAGENPSFYRDFLKSSVQKYGMEWTLSHRTIDLHSLCYTHYLKRGLKPPIKDNKTDLNSDKILNYIGLPDEPRPHNALTGAKVEAEAFSRLIFGKLLLREFKNYPIPDYLL